MPEHLKENTLIIIAKYSDNIIAGALNFVSNNKLYGRGTADMKSFIACALHTAIKSSSMTLTTPLHFAFSYDEEIDEEREIKKKKIALKEQVANAKSHLDGQKSKYYEEIKAGSRLTPEQQKAMNFFNRYNKESEETNKIAEKQTNTFKLKTQKVFNIYFIHLIVNASWSIAFFALHQILVYLAIIGLIIFFVLYWFVIY